jgi:GH24 family phage-related lysozyme (muramidase)
MFLRVFSRISLVWGVIFLLRTALRVVALASGSVDRFVVVNLATGFPLTAALVSWSFWYGVRSLQRAAEIR